MSKALVERGCDPSHLDLNKKSALDFARKSRSQELVDFLILEIKKTRDHQSSSYKAKAGRKGSKQAK